MDTLDPKLAAISLEMNNHYTTALKTHGPGPRGVDWGCLEDVILRYSKMLAVVPPEEWSRGKPHLLDVGCGYGGLLSHLLNEKKSAQFSGIDVSKEMIEEASRTFPQESWIQGDVLEMPEDQKFDYVVCNGILTQKLSASHLDMNLYAQTVIKKLFSLCKKGVAFNVMSTYVNFQKASLYYRSPVEMLGFCLSEITRKVRLDHSYLYEYTVYLYR
jgi:2-polyprenyl-3-methyl-5-hydroxy-6-metoxy-1,4-benzoquinol methylase